MNMDKFEENLDEFIAKAEKAHELVSLLQSEDPGVVKETQDKIDNILKNDWEAEDKEYKTKDGFSKSQISRFGDYDSQLGDSPAFPSDQAGFMKAVEEDANRRAANRRRKEEKAKARKEKGNCAFSNGDYHKAVEEYDVAINLAGWCLSFYTNKAQALIRLEEYDKAVETCDRAIQIEEGFTKAYIQKSNALLAKGCCKEAVECLETCLESCKDKTDVVTKYLNNARNRHEYNEDNKSIMSSISQDTIKEFRHLISKMQSEKIFEASLASEFMIKLLEDNKDNCRLFRALGGISRCLVHFKSCADSPLLSNLLDIFYLVLSQDNILLKAWNSLHPSWPTALLTNTSDLSYRQKLLLWLQKMLYHDNNTVYNTVMDGWNNSLTTFVLGSFENTASRPMVLLILPQILKDSGCANKLKVNVEVVDFLKVLSKSVAALVDEASSEQKVWIAALSGLSLSSLARHALDGAFWGVFLSLLESLREAGHVELVKELLTVGYNFAAESKALVEHSSKITEVLVSMNGEECRLPQVPVLLSRVLEKCPNTILAEDKDQFSALLKTIKGYKTFDDDLNTAVKLLTRNTAKSVQARKWVCKYNVLEKLLEILASGDVSVSTEKTYSAILANAALCCAHCFIDPKVCKLQESETVDLLLRHAKADKGLPIQENAAIGLARLATHNPALLNRLRETRGLEVLHSRYNG